VKTYIAGFNHFEAREYDPVIGRTMVVDPARQFASPYMWVGNNPISRFDPSGGFSPPDGYIDDQGHKVWHEGRTESSFIDENGQEWKWVTGNRDLWDSWTFGDIT